MRRRVPHWIILIWLIAPLVGCKSRGASRSEAEQNPLACASLVADRLGERSPQLLEQVAIGYAHSGDCERAFQVADSISERRWLNFDSVGASIKGELFGRLYAECVRIGDSKVAEKSYSAALQIIARIPKSEYRVVSSGALRSLAMNHADLGNDREALQLLNQVEVSAGPDDRDSIVASRANNLIEVAGKIAGAGKNAQAGKLLGNALKITNSINDPRLRAGIWINAAEVYIKLGEYEQGAELLSQRLTLTASAHDDAYRGDDVLRVIHAYARARAFDRAEKMIPLIKFEYQRSWALRDVAVEIARSGACLKAKALSEKITGSSDRADVLKAIVAKYAESDELAEAIEAADLTKSFLNRADARLTIARKYVQMNDRSNAEKFLNLALDDVHKETAASEYEIQSRLGYIALGFASIGDRARALPMLKRVGQMEESGGLMVELAVSAATMGEYEVAIEIAKAIVKDTHIAHVGTFTQEFYRAEAIIGILLKHAEAKRKGMDQDKNVQQLVLKALG